jgi:hypothetical protein
MPAKHDLDPPAMTETERLDKRRYQAYHAFEMNPPMRKRSDHFHLGAFGYIPKDDEGDGDE